MPSAKTACLTLWLELVSRRAALRERGRERGAAMAEYGMLVVLVGIAAFAILTLVGGEVWELFRETEATTDAREVPPPAD